MFCILLQGILSFFLNSKIVNYLNTCCSLYRYETIYKSIYKLVNVIKSKQNKRYSTTKTAHKQHKTTKNLRLRKV